MSAASAARFAVGIDLGTTHCAMAVAALGEAPGSETAVEVVEVDQLVGTGELEGRRLLPSFVYFPPESEGALPLPWDPERRYCVGEHARARAPEAPGRVVSSAKSWLCHPSIDRRSGILPLGAPDDLEKISPVEVSFRLLDHLGEVFARRYGVPLGDQDVVLAVPASFDAQARELTVEAATVAGIEEPILLEEPQAALYAWIDRSGEAWRQRLRPGDVVLVVDIGGGTTDLSAIAAEERDGALELERIAVGDHILLGGDNMDLLLAHRLRAELEARGAEIGALEMAALGHAARAAKERMLGPRPPDKVPVAIARRGAKLVGGALRGELDRATVESLLLDGFFPDVPADAAPAPRPRAALRQLGLPYASDPAVTKHLAQFLARHRGARGGAGALLRPSALLFNGGVLASKRVRERLRTTLDGWLAADGAEPARELPGADLDLAVARGAAYYGRVRRGRGVRIRGGTARAYYVGIEGAAPAVPGVEPPVQALCVAPFGMEEGTAAAFPAEELYAVVGEPVRFRFFASTVRRDDEAGARIDLGPGGGGPTARRARPGELEELAPIEVVLPTEGRAEGDVVPVHLGASVTAIGTLLLEAVPLEPRKDGERWRVELNVRGAR
ncbi:MAG: Hsp70 family protein [Polyangiaceae bacterium]|nr:Hsp70 family protein [Polyangiaceae bacterium]